MEGVLEGVGVEIAIDYPDSHNNVLHDQHGPKNDDGVDQLIVLHEMGGSNHDGLDENHPQLKGRRGQVDDFELS